MSEEIRKGKGKFSGITFGVCKSKRINNTLGASINSIDWNFDNSMTKHNENLVEALRKVMTKSQAFLDEIVESNGYTTNMLDDYMESTWEVDILIETPVDIPDGVQ